MGCHRPTIVVRGRGHRGKEYRASSARRKDQGAWIGELQRKVGGVNIRCGWRGSSPLTVLKLKNEL